MGRLPPALEERTLYWEDHDQKFSQALRAANLLASLELLDLDSDVGEKRNVASSHPERVADFERFLITAGTPSPYWPDPK